MQKHEFYKIVNAVTGELIAAFHYSAAMPGLLPLLKGKSIIIEPLEEGLCKASL